MTTTDFDPFLPEDEQPGSKGTDTSATREPFTAATLLERMQRTGKVPDGFSINMIYPTATDAEIHNAVTSLSNDGYIANDPGESFALMARLDKCRFQASGQPEAKPVAQPAETKSKPAVTTTAKPAKQDTAKQAVPKPATPYRDPTKQNEHAWCLIDMSGLTTTEKWVGNVMHYLCYADGKKGETSPSRQLAARFLADKVGVSESTAKRAANRLVERGLFARVDNGKGGRVQRSETGTGFGARYRPVVPSWWTSKGA